MTVSFAIIEARGELYERAKITASARYIRHHGLDPAEIEARGGCLCVVRGDILTVGWEFRADGELLAVVEVFDASDEAVVDLLAWAVDEPTTSRTLLGRAAILGASQVESPATYHNDMPLLVHRTPLGWLRAGCRGVVILEPALAADVLSAAPGRIAGEDVDHARELLRLLRHRLPARRIVAPLPRAAA